MNSAPSAHNADNRSLKSGFVAILASECPQLVGHVPRGGEDRFRPLSAPELPIERTVVGLAVSERAGHDLASRTHVLKIAPAKPGTPGHAVAGA